MAKRRKMNPSDITGVIPTNIDPWIIDQFSRYVKEERFLREMSEKADDDWVKEKFRGLERENENNLKEIKEHKNKISLIPKPKEIEGIKKTMSGWEDWFRKIVIGVAFLVIGSGSAVVWNYSALHSKVEMTCENVKKISISVREIQKAQIELNNKFEFYKKRFKQNNSTWVRKNPIELLKKKKDS